ARGGDTVGARRATRAILRSRDRWNELSAGRLFCPGPGPWAPRIRLAPAKEAFLMGVTPKRRLELVTGRSHPELAEEIASCLGVSLSETNIRGFADGEIHCRFDTSMRGADM